MDEFINLDLAALVIMHGKLCSGETLDDPEWLAFNCYETARALMREKERRAGVDSAPAAPLPSDRVAS